MVELPEVSLEELAHTLDMIGHAVDGVEVLEPDWSEVYVGKVLEVEPHPDADRIRVCQVDAGWGLTQIICGAWNFEAGALVPVARPGAVLAGGFEIGERAIRGVQSKGMICSEKELGLGDDHTGILVLDGDPEVGSPFVEYVELPDVVFDLDITSNRSDAMSILGIARDLAAYYRTEHHLPEVNLVTVPGQASVTVDIGDPSGCRRFVAREIRDVSLAPAPLWMRYRLHKAGFRSISNVVDVTNYVMVELGHPLHAFDADQIEGDHLIIRRASPGEVLVTLDGEERKLHPDDLIIYDEVGPISMSGTMGGERSEVAGTTTRVLMEAASWDPPTIMFMSRRHKLLSEASIRFERGVDPNLSELANRRASALVSELAGGEVLEGYVDEATGTFDPWVVDLTQRDVERLLGPGIETDETVDILQRLEMEVEGEEPMRVTVPTFRPDVTRPTDLIEEIARIHGFDEFGATLPTGQAGGLTTEQARLRLLIRSLASLGLHQASDLPFVSLEDMVDLGWEVGDADLLRVKNPLSEEAGLLRPALLPGLLRSVRYNLARGAGEVALFEVGRVFSTVPDPDDPRLPKQPQRVAWAAVGEMGPRALGASRLVVDGRVSLAIWAHLARSLAITDYEVVASYAPGFHPSRAAEIRIGGEVVGHVGELSPGAGRAYGVSGRVAVAELDLAPLVAPVPFAQLRPPSPYPPVDFDLSFVIAVEQPVAELVRATTAAAEGLVESARVFDEFRGEGVGEGTRAVAIRYRLRAPDRTLSSEEVAPVREAMIQAGERMGARLRGAQ
jgi:phenylalanyl-tRNA synthetase beta chain